MSKKILKDKLKARFKRDLVKLEIQDEDFGNLYTRVVSVREAFVLYKLFEEITKNVKDEEDETDETQEVEKIELNIDEVLDQIDTIKDFISKTLRYEDGELVVENEEDYDNILEGMPVSLAKDLFNEIVNKCKFNDVLGREQIAKN